MISGQATFRRLVERHGPRILGLAHRIVGDPARAEDIVQDVFTRLYQRRRYIHDEKTIGSWLYRTTLNRSFDELRRLQRIRRAESEARPPDGPGTDAWFRAETARLPRAMRAAVLLVYGEGMAPAEAAGILGCTPNALRQRLFAAREQLRLKLSEGVHDDTAPCGAPTR